jgi:hypothetical protein
MLTRVLRTVRLGTIDKRSQFGWALRKLKDELTAQLGGPDQVTPALALLIEPVPVQVTGTALSGVAFERSTRSCRTRTISGWNRKTSQRSDCQTRPGSTSVSVCMGRADGPAPLAESLGRDTA